MRGLPYDCKPKEVAKFFDDCKIVGGDAGVFFPTNEKWDLVMLRFSLDVAITGVWSLEKPLSSWLGRNTWRELSSATSKVLEKGELSEVGGEF